MKRQILAGSAVLVAGAIAVAGGSVALAGNGGGDYEGYGKGRSIYVIEHATTDTVSHAGGAGDAVGDVLTFHNDVFDRTNTTKVGTDNGYCIRTQFGPDLSTWECNITTTLHKGSLTVEGQFNELPSADSTLAITGGTGAYRDARGQMVLHSLNATEFSFAFRVTR